MQGFVSTARWHDIFQPITIAPAAISTCPHHGGFFCRLILRLDYHAHLTESLNLECVLKSTPSEHQAHLLRV